MPIDPTKIHLLDPVLKWLDSGAPHVKAGRRKRVGFNMKHGIVSGHVNDFANNPCGTAVCIAGALIVFNSILVPRGQTIVGRFRTLLGLTEQEAFQLFTPLSVHDWSTLTPKIAADTIRHFIATGVVDWGLNGAPLYEREPFHGSPWYGVLPYHSKPPTH
jgi:hypothetical protein